MQISTLLKWITGGLEIVLGIPILGAIIVLSSLLSILGLMIILHIVTLIFSVREQTKPHGSILGIVTCLVGWIPGVAMVMHLITGIVLLLDAAKTK